MSRSLPRAAAGRVCPFCAFRYGGAPITCPRCGTFLGEDSADLSRFAQAERRRLRTRKAVSDTIFLVGLLLGGPMLTIGGNVGIGAFLVLAAGFISVIRRYTDASLPGALTLGSLCALVIAAVVVSPATHAYEATLVDDAARQAFATALAGNGDMYVEARGPGAVVIWFQVPADRSRECGDFPPVELRAHLRDLGFLRIVMVERNQSGGLCSFVP